MTFNEIVAGIDRHFRLRGEGRQRRAATEAGVSFAWPQGTNLTREQMEIAETWIERATPGNTPVLGGIVGTQDADGSTVVWSDGPAVYGHGETAGAAMRDYAESVVDVRDIQRRYGDAFDGKAAIREQLAHAERGDAGDGHEPPPDYEVWAR
jgi:hypothetical protein